MSKYVVLNCPAKNPDKDWCRAEQKPCSDCKCMVKEIYNRCEEDCVEVGGIELRYDTLCDIMELYKIKEVEEC